MGITLPNALRRAELRSFCLIITIGALVMLAILRGLSAGFVYWAVPVLIGCIAGLLYPRLIRIPYRIWNKSSKLYGRYACIYIMAVAFHLIVGLTGNSRFSKQFTGTGAARSSWVPRPSPDQLVYQSQYQLPDGLTTHARWPVAYLAWAWRTRNIPALFVLPLLVLLSILQPEEECFHASEIYTLF